MIFFYSLCLSVLIGSLSAAEQVQGLTEDHSVEASAAFSRGNWDVARDLYVKMLATRPDDARLLANLGTVEFQAGLGEKARMYLEKSVFLEPSLASSWFLLGMLYRDDDQLYHAISAFSRAVHEDPRHAAAHHYLALTMRENGWLDAAETELLRSLELSTENADAHYNLALILLERDPPQAGLARYHYRKSLEQGAKPDAEIERRLSLILKDENEVSTGSTEAD